IIVAGKNFGCGSSREQAPEILVKLNVKCIIAKSYARIFYRNAINNGLLLIENKYLPDKCKEGDVVEVHLNHNITHNGEEYKIMSLPDNLMKIINDGGLVQNMRKRNDV
ncbi:3-isopropylmalate dehydratase, partial [Clostridium sp.]|uniref:LeuD/DmdB family oxidoreductase small subunit n=1 Tax=Clostridium sp. TaxID=1506 RepID=UPI00262CBEC3